MMGTSYPEDWPVVDIRTLWEIVRSGDMAARKQELALSAWVVQGYAQSQLIGNPGDNTGPIWSTEATPEHVLESMVISEGIEAAKIPWAVILKFLLEKILPFILVA